MPVISRRTVLAASVAAACGAGAGAAERPNILWIVSEDNNPYLGCYGDPVARTPVLDRLAAQGVLYENCFSAAPVCAPSRFTLITGLYATSCSPANHMRAQGKIPAFLRGFPAYLRDAGYYCTNNAKTDYNAPIRMKDAWDESGKQAHWRNRPAGKPFFAVFNHEVTHESQVFPKNAAKYKPVANPTDPAKVRLPAYHPDTPEFRRDRATYYDHMQRLDEQVGKLLAQLEADGLLDSTIIFYYGDNGGVLPRSKRFCYDSGLHVPLIIKCPEKFAYLAPGKPGSRIADPVSFVDFAPTVLSLAGVKAPQHMQGHAFAGTQRAEPQTYAFGFRGRMDDRYDMVRTVRDRRYRYIRNYMPHLIYGQHVRYMFQQRSMQQWRELHDQGKLNDAQDAFWRTKPFEELYDLQADPDEVKNLAAVAEHQQRMEAMRKACDGIMLTSRDNGFIPEGSALEGYDNGRDDAKYPLARLMELAATAAQRNAEKLPKLIEAMGDGNECVRYWGALGCVMLRGKAAGAAEALRRLLKDDSAQVRVAAAEALCHLGQEAVALPVLTALLADASARVRLQAVNAMQNIAPKSKSALADIEKAVKDSDDYVRRAAEYTAAHLKGAPLVFEEP